MLKQHYFLIVFLFPFSCLGATEPAPILQTQALPQSEQYPTFFQAIACTVLNQRPELEIISNYPNRPHELVCEYVESKRAVGALRMLARNPGGDVVSLSCDTSFIPQVLAAEALSKNDIVALIGEDDDGRKTYTSNENFESLRMVATPHMPVSCAFEDEWRQGVWEVPGDVAIFLSTPCPDFDIEAANQRALADYKKRSAKDRSRSWNPVGSGNEKLETYPPALLQQLPNVLRALIIGYLGEKTITAYAKRIMKADGTYIRMVLNRPILACEHVVAMIGYVNPQKNPNFGKFPYLALCDPQTLPDQNNPRLADLVSTAISYQIKSREELVELASLANTPLPSIEHALDGKPFKPNSHIHLDAGLASFTAPSLAALLLLGKLPDQFIEDNTGYTEDDEAPEEDTKARVIITEQKDDGAQ